MNNANSKATETRFNYSACEVLRILWAWLHTTEHEPTVAETQHALRYFANDVRAEYAADAQS